MVKIEPFSVEAWMDKHENNCKYNIAETCCASISLDQLRELSEDKDTPIIDPSAILNYGAIRGSTQLRENLARLYSAKGTPLPVDNILTTPGAIQANALVFYSLVGPGDHVICHYPTYQSLYEVPKQLGATVDLWRATPENHWIPQIEQLKALIKPGTTKLLVINNPHNPTGAILPKPTLQEIIEIAAEHNITVLADEVYRPIFHSIGPLDRNFPPSLLSMGYKNVIVTGSLSKAYSLAGIRVGWIASRNPGFIEQIAEARHYTTISVSQLDEAVASFALHPSTVHKLLHRNIELARTNLALLERFVLKNEDECDWVRPVAGTTAFVRFHRGGRAVDDVDFCVKLLDKTGVLLVPGSECFGGGNEFKGYVRIGFVNQTDIIKEGLDKVTGFVRKFLDEVKFADEV